MERTSDMNPLLRIAVIFAIGIITSERIGTDIHAAYWLTGTIAALILALYKQKTWQSVALYITIYMLGGFLTCQKLAQTYFDLPENAVSYEAVIFSQPEETNKSIRCDLMITNASRPVKIKAAFLKDSVSKTLRTGDGIEAMSILKAPENYPDANFDYAKYLKYHDYAGTTFINSRNWQRKIISLKNIPRTERARLSAMKLRTKLLQEYKEAGIEEHNFQIISAMTLGEKSFLTKETKAEFSVSGASHILALSGLHLSIIYAILSAFAGRHRRSFIVQSFLIIAVWAFVFIVGMPNSAVRAAIMLTVYSLATLLNRGRISLNTLAVAAITILSGDPLALYDIGFQLSFMSVLFILLLYPRISILFPALQKHAATKYLWQITTVSIAAQIGTMPLIAFHFERIPCYSLVSNLFVIPATYLIICGSIITLLLSPIPSLQHLVATAVSELTELMSGGITLLSSLPYSSTSISLSVLQATILYIIIFALLSLSKRISIRPFFEPDDKTHNIWQKDFEASKDNYTKEAVAKDSLTTVSTLS